jgi:sec-independent protein translocase protein TatA
MELILIFLIVVLLFGSRKIPEIAKGLGKGIRDFKSSLSGEDEANADTKGLAKPAESRGTESKPSQDQSKT